MAIRGRTSSVQLHFRPKNLPESTLTTAIATLHPTSPACELRRPFLSKGPGYHSGLADIDDGGASRTVACRGLLYIEYR